jgi:hypothetical protein
VKIDPRIIEVAGMAQQFTDQLERHRQEAEQLKEADSRLSDRVTELVEAGVMLPKIGYPTPFGTFAIIGRTIEGDYQTIFLNHPQEDEE